jgi:hypothetical protein
MVAMRRLLGLCVLAVCAGEAHGGPAEATAERPMDAGAGPAIGFRLEGKPAIDDVFGDASDYRRTVDRFLELTDAMQSMRDEFAKSVQAALSELSRAAGADAGKRPRKGSCPADTVATPYARAHKFGADYLRVGRELTRHYDQVKEFDRLGESIGLTPDYRWKVRRVLQHYHALLTDYREMKVAFHDQLDDELKYAGCNLQALLLRGEPGKPAQAATPTEEAWPSPGQAGAPGVVLAKGAKVPPREKLPPSLPAEKVPPTQPITLPVKPHPAGPMPADARDTQPRVGILFYVDNSKCQRGTTVYLDGKKVGEVAAAQRVGFQTVPGPHDLCLLDSSQKQCGQPGTVRRSYMHEGWTISLRCE